MIENHPHREALQADLQQNNVYNPVSENSKEMIRDLGNVELSELCETTPKIQCSQCLLYWNQGIVNCTCGQFLIDSESRRNFNQTTTGRTLYPALRDQERALSWCSTGQDRGTKYHMAWNAWKRCCKKVDSQDEFFSGIHDRFLRDPVYRESRLAVGWSQQMCKEWDELAKEDHPGQQRRIQQGQEVFSEDYLSIPRVDQHTGWQY